MKAKNTAHNRTVYAAPAVAGYIQSERYITFASKFGKTILHGNNPEIRLTKKYLNYKVMFTF